MSRKSAISLLLALAVFLIPFAVLILNVNAQSPELTATPREPSEWDSLDGDSKTAWNVASEYMSDIPYDVSSLKDKNICMRHPADNENGWDEYIEFGYVWWSEKWGHLLFIQLVTGTTTKFINVGKVGGYIPTREFLEYDEPIYKALREAALYNDSDLVIERIGWFLNGIPESTPTSTSTPTETFTPTPTNTRTPAPTRTLAPAKTQTLTPTIQQVATPVPLVENTQENWNNMAPDTGKSESLPKRILNAIMSFFGFAK